jgi:hypothetical protein
MAGGTNVGSLNATLSLSAFEFNHGLEQSAAAAREFADQTTIAANRANMAMSKVGGAGGKAGMEGFKNAAYAVQDFSSQINNGLGPAMNAIANNLIPMAAAIPGPWKAAVIAVAVAAPLIIGNYEKIGQALGLMTGTSKKDLESFASAWDKTMSLQTSKREMDRDALKNPVKEFDDKQQGRRDKMADLYEEISSTNKKIQSLEAGEKPGSVWSQQAAVLRKEVDQKIAEWKRIQAEEKSISKLRPDVLTNEAQRAVEDKKKAADEADKLRLNKGTSEELNFKLSALEKFGTASQKLTAKQEKERSELSDKMKGLVESESALALQQYGHEAEAKKLQIEDSEKGIGKLGNMPGMSAGLRTDSSEGLSQMNKWAQGDAGKSVLQQQLEVQKKQLTLMEQQARGEVLSPHEKSIMAGNDEQATLGIATDRWDKSGHQDLWANHWKKDAEKNRQMGFGEWDKGQTARDNRPGNAEVQSVLTAKRARETESSQQVKERIEILKELREANKLSADRNRRPVARVVALN